MAVNEATGDVYVVDTSDNRVEWFSATGKFEGQFNGGATYEVGGTVEPTTAAGNGIYATEPPPPGVSKEIPTGAFALQSGSEISGIAVDNSCLYHKPHALTGGACEGEDPSAGDVYVADAGHNVVDKFSPAGAYLGQITGVPGKGEGTGPFVEVLGVAVDENGTAWIHSNGNSANDADGFDDHLPNDFLAPQINLSSNKFPFFGFAVGAEGEFFVGLGLPGITPPTIGEWSHAGGLPITEEFGGEEALGVAAELSSADVYLGNSASVSRLDANGNLVERLSAPELTVSALGVSSASETVYAANAQTNLVDIFAPEPPAPPSVEGESVAEVTSATAVLQAELNPRGADTTYQFEYGICATEATCETSAFELPVPVLAPSIGSGFAISPVSLLVEGLTPHRAYHFRVRAVNAEGAPVPGEERVFVTQPSGGVLVLPEGAAWEMVSPPDKHGALIEALEPEGDAPEGFVNLSQASVTGDAVSYPATGPTESDPTGYSNSVQVLSTRGKSGWSSRDLTVGHVAQAGPSTEGFEYRAFSSDLSSGVVQPFGPFVPSSSSLALAPEEASEQTAFLGSDFLAGNVNAPCVVPMRCFRPLVTDAPGFSNVPPGTVFGVSNDRGTCPPGLICGPNFEGGNSDLSAIVLTSLVPLSAAPVVSNGLYEWQAGVLHPVSVLPVAEGGGPGAEPFLGAGRTGFTKNARGAVSADGSRVFWATASGLFMRDTVSEQTLRLDVPEAGAGGGTPAPEFELASVDGSRVIFKDSQSLTVGAGSGDLYECAIADTAGQLTCALSDLTPPAGGESAEVLGTVLGASEDASWVYFAANGVQGGAVGAVHGTCQQGRPGSLCNLYVRHGGVTRLVAVVSGADAEDWELAHWTSRVSPNGERLAFMSQREITGYDNRPASPFDCLASGNIGKVSAPCSEVFEYDAATQHVVCVSCNPSGARPEGPAKIPEWSKYSLKQTLYQSRLLSNTGRLIFDSSDEVTPQHVTRNQDVFEYQPVGVGGCSKESLAFSEAFSPGEGGCVGLVSSGHASGESSYVDSSASDEDIFFLTSGKLLPQDVDTAPDVYDAHVCPAGSSCIPPASAVPPPCTTADSCRAAPSPQPEGFGAPASATFNGAGNVTPTASVVKAKAKAPTRAQKLAAALKVCKQKPKRQRAGCEKQARRKYGTPQKPKKKPAKTNRGARR